MERGPNDHVAPGAQLDTGDGHEAFEAPRASMPIVSINLDEERAESFKQGFEAGVASKQSRSSESAAAIAEQREKAKEWLNGQTDPATVIRSARLGLQEVLLDDLQVTDNALPHIFAVYDALERLGSLLNLS